MQSFNNLLLLVLLACLSVVAYAQQNNQDIIFISTVVEFKNFAYRVNKGEKFESKKVVLTKDLFLNDTTGWRHWQVEAIGKSQWIPIGTWKYPFRGYFDGGGHTIYGLYINRETNGFFQGLFGCIDGSIIENLHLKMSVIKGCQYVGGIVGMVADNISNGNDSTIIRNCSNMGTVIGSRNYVGGIAGVIYDPLAGIFNCKNKGSIQGKNRIGGIVGYCCVNHVHNCCNQGPIYGLTLVGGISGVFFMNEKNKIVTTVINCYNTGDIHARLYGAGIAGQLDFCDTRLLKNYVPILSLSNCYNAGRVECNYIASEDNLIGVYRKGNNDIYPLSMISKACSINYSLKDEIHLLMNKYTLNYSSSPMNVVKVTAE